MTNASSRRGPEGIRRYYEQVAPFLDAELERRGDLGYWTSLVQRLVPTSVLELGCGTGRVTRALAGRAARVVAVDLSPELLARARRRLATCAAVTLVLADMRSLDLGDVFDLVVAPDDPFVHLLSGDDRDAALEAVARHLAPGGRFVIDGMWWTPGELAAARGAAGLTKDRLCRYEGPGNLHVHETWHADAEGPGFEARYLYAAGGRTLREASFRGRRWTREEVEERLPKVGLEVARLRGGYDGRPFEAATAEALIVEARRGPSSGTST